MGWAVGRWTLCKWLGMSRMFRTYIKVTCKLHCRLHNHSSQKCKIKMISLVCVHRKDDYIHSITRSQKQIYPPHPPNKAGFIPCNLPPPWPLSNYGNKCITFQHEEWFCKSYTEHNTSHYSQMDSKKPMHQLFNPIYPIPIYSINKL